ncbi:uncharacterized protein LOC120653912 [Panicum virgatum]|uniref:uncharacterized protein LOC120653912 n=1 Tax=Panicum virgatum TaxID=38727 RepID=UPI0019D67F1D|nr:uncharacterized protein LOC120653912 [Panicum virgatum]
MPRFFPNSHGNEVAAGSAELVGGRPSERAAAAEEEAAHHGDEHDGLDGRDDALERGVHQEQHVPHQLRPRPRHRRAELLRLDHCHHSCTGAGGRAGGEGSSAARLRRPRCARSGEATREGRRHAACRTEAARSTQDWPGHGTLCLDGSQACTTVSTGGWRSTCCAANQTSLAGACEAYQCTVVHAEVSASAVEAMAAQEVHPTMAVARGFGEAVITTVNGGFTVGRKGVGSEQ